MHINEDKRNLALAIKGTFYLPVLLNSITFAVRLRESSAMRTAFCPNNVDHLTSELD